MAEHFKKILTLAAIVFLVQYVYPGVLQGVMAAAGVDAVGK